MHLAWTVVSMGSRRGVIAIRATVMGMIPVQVLKMVQIEGKRHKGS